MLLVEYFLLINKMSDMQKFLNTIWKFTGKEDNFIQKALKVCKVFKVKPLKTPKPDVP